MKKSIILLYHRVIELISDPQLLSVSLSNFTEHMEFLCNNFNIISLEEMVNKQKKGELSDNSVAITFDDGYSDNSSYVKPLLKKLEIPATFFVTTCNIGTKREFWWDELERLLLYPGKLKSENFIDFFGLNLSLNLKQAADYSEKDFEKNRLWTVLDSSNPGPRHELYIRLCSELRGMSLHQREQIIDYIRLCGGLPETGRDTHLSLSYDQLSQLGNDHFLDIGSHTVSHSVLSNLSADNQRFEIVKSKECLEKITGQTIKSFSYPFGNIGDYTKQARDFVCEAGYQYSCSNFPGLVGPDTDPFQLPRFLVRNWNKDEFASTLVSWFKDNYAAE